MDASFEVVDHLHELFLTNSQVSEHSDPFFPVLPNVVEDGLCEVLDHVLGFGLAPSEVVFHHNGAVFLIRERTII